MTETATVTKEQAQNIPTTADFLLSAFQLVRLEGSPVGKFIRNNVQANRAGSLDPEQIHEATGIVRAHVDQCLQMIEICASMAHRSITIKQSQEFVLRQETDYPEQYKIDATTIFNAFMQAYDKTSATRPVWKKIKDQSDQIMVQKILEAK